MLAYWGVDQGLWGPSPSNATPTTVSRPQYTFNIIKIMVARACTNENPKAEEKLQGKK